MLQPDPARLEFPLPRPCSWRAGAPAIYASLLAVISLIVVATGTTTIAAAQARPPAQSRPESRPDSQPLAKRDWFARHQCPDGRWRSDAIDTCAEPDPGSHCDDPGTPGLDVGVTGLVLLAFMGAGYDDERPGAYRETVARGLAYLEQTQAKDGWFGSPNDPHATWSQAIATRAMSEDARISNRERWRLSARVGLRRIAAESPPRWPWQDGATPADDNVLVTAWALLAATDGPDAVDRSLARKLLAWLERYVEDQGVTTAPTSTRVATASAPARLPRFGDRAMAAAAALLARDRLSLTETEVVARHRKVIETQLRDWSDPTASIDPQAWYFVGQEAFSCGGALWETFREQSKRVVVGRMRRDGCARGSWDPSDPFCRMAGRTANSAIMTLSFQLHWRIKVIYR